MATRADVEARRAQIAAITRNTPAQAAVCAALVDFLDRALATDAAVDADALWAACDAAMEARAAGRAWAAPVKSEPVRMVARVVEELATPDVAPATPVVAISPRTGKPKRKYQRRKKA